MPVVSYCSNRGRTLRSAHRFLDHWINQVKRHQCPQLVSLSFDIPPVDPLVVLDRLAPTGDRHFYLEHPADRAAVVGFGTALCYETSGLDRFAQARRFIDQWLSDLQSYSEVNPAAGQEGAQWARFFCAFTFFAATARGAKFPAAAVVLPQWQIVRQESQGVLTLNYVLSANTDIGTLIETLAQQLRSIERLSRQPWPGGSSHCLGRPVPFPQGLVQPDWAAGEQFRSAVHRALGHMTQYPVEKIVLAHALDWVSPCPLQPIASLGQLRQRYPDCHLFSLSHGQGKTFIGASPERLISLTQGQLVTDALAGSARRGATTEEDAILAQQLLGNPKERGEHRLVVDFLTQRLQEAGLRPQYHHRPGLRRLSNIQHLHTPIRAAVTHRTHPLQIVEALHPTPAVAGVPTRAACDQILRFEDFDRDLYAAPLGWVGANGDSEFIVGIRSALIAGTCARLYAGAGIVAGSDPNREWAELQLKFRALGESLR
jgi:menaquinone-specific isochorismate synthase